MTNGSTNEIVSKIIKLKARGNYITYFTNG
jgi:hypothetical protein